jgi:hypothetical protein
MRRSASWLGVHDFSRRPLTGQGVYAVDFSAGEMRSTRSRIGRDPSSREPVGWWSKLGRRGRAGLVLGLLFLAVWSVIAVPPFFAPQHDVPLCAADVGCDNLPQSEFALGEIVLAASLLGVAAVGFVPAFRASRRPANPGEGVSDFL